MRSVSFLSAALLAVLAGHAQAQAYRNGPDYDYAEVVRVDPIIETTQQPVYRDECWGEPVTYREPDRYVRRGGPQAPAVLGGILGGVVGNQFGGGRGRDAATAAGAILGYSLVRDAQGGHYQPGREYTQYERRCTQRTDYRRDEHVRGYEVTYRYHGRLYSTVTDYPPGDRLRVRVDVSPAP